MIDQDVPAQAPRKSPCRMMLVGEAPSDEEMHFGRPLVGPSGKLMDAILRRADIDRDEIAISNVFSTQLPDNDVLNWCVSSRAKASWGNSDEAQVARALPPVKKGAYLKPEYVGHLLRLRQEVERFDPAVIVPLGATALWAFSGMCDSIMRRRGVPDLARWTTPGRKIMPTVHPSSVLRDYSLWHVAVIDLKHAWTQGESRRLLIPRRRLRIDPTMADLAKFEREFINPAKKICIDIETKPRYRQITCVGFGTSATQAMVVPLVDWRKPNRCYWSTLDEELEAIEYIRRWCENDAIKLGQNYPYDFQWLYTLWGIRTRNYREDTRLLHHSIYPELPKDLHYLGTLYANPGFPWKSWSHGMTSEKRDA